jgi:hypothetical protein
MHRLHGLMPGQMLADVAHRVPPQSEQANGHYAALGGIGMDVFLDAQKSILKITQRVEPRAASGPLISSRRGMKF